MRQDPPGSFLLPVLYGALRTCAFVLRNLFRKMVDRSFDRRRTGEFTVRIFLGMLSGLSLQWLVVRADGTVAGGMTPAVLQERACSRETNCPNRVRLRTRRLPLSAGRLRKDRRGRRVVADGRFQSTTSHARPDADRAGVELLARARTRKPVPKSRHRLRPCLSPARRVSRSAGPAALLTGRAPRASAPPARRWRTTRHAADACTRRAPRSGLPARRGR